MPFTEQGNVIRSFIVTLLAFLLVVTSLGLTARDNTGNYCLLFTTYNSSDFRLLLPKSTAYCELSLSSAIIAMSCLAIPFFIELLKVVFGTKTLKEQKISFIMQIVLRIISIIFLLINTLVMSIGWASTNNTLGSHYDHTTNITGGGVIGAIVFAGSGALLTLISLPVYIKHNLSIVRRKDHTPIEDATEIIQ